MPSSADGHLRSWGFANATLLGEGPPPSKGTVPKECLNTLVPRVQKNPQFNFNRLLIVEFVEKMVCFGAH